MEIKDYIKTYDDVLPVTSLCSFIKYLNSSKEFSKAKIVEGEDFDVRRTWTLNLSPMSPSLTNVHWANLWTYVLNKCFSDYSKTFSKTSTNYYNRIVEITALKYEKDGFYKTHWDHCLDFPRTLSAIVLLNNDYKGGELCFKDPDGSNDNVILTKSNRIIVWPSTFLYPHEVKPVIEGVRYSIVSWAL